MNVIVGMYVSATPRGVTRRVKRRKGIEPAVNIPYTKLVRAFSPNNQIPPRMRSISPATSISERSVVTMTREASMTAGFYRQGAAR